MPQVVGITVHLTFARRAYELAHWFRARGSKVILGGLHVLSCPDECVSHSSIWRRRPEDWRSVPPYFAMSYLYNRSNGFWRLLIKHDLVHTVWQPLVELIRVRHLRFRRELEARMEAGDRPPV